MIYYYLLIGVSFYIGVAISRRDSFKNATIWSIIKGLFLGLILWPVGIITLYIVTSKTNTCAECKYFMNDCYITKYGIGEVVIDNNQIDQTIYVDKDFCCKCWKYK